MVLLLLFNSLLGQSQAWEHLYLYVQLSQYPSIFHLHFQILLFLLGHHLCWTINIICNVLKTSKSMYHCHNNPTFHALKHCHCHLYQYNMLVPEMHLSLYRQFWLICVMTGHRQMKWLEIDKSIIIDYFFIKSSFSTFYLIIL